MFYAGRLVTSRFLFVLSQLLFDFRNRTVECVENRVGLSAGYEVGSMLSRDVNLYVRAFLVLQVHGYVDGVNLIEKTSDLFRFF